MSAREENSPEKWDALWEREGDDTWRGKTLAQVYEEVLSHIPPGLRVHDLGGGRGLLAARMRQRLAADVTVWDSSPVAVRACAEKGIPAALVDLEDAISREKMTIGVNHIVVMTECYEHLSEGTRIHLLELCYLRGVRSIMMSVPNDRLGPKDCPQHTVQFTGASLADEIRKTRWNMRAISITSILSGSESFLLAKLGE